MLVTLIYVVIALVIVGVVLYLLESVPMDPTIRVVIRVVVVLAVVLYLLSLLVGLPALRLG